MRILSIDSGLERTGYAVFEKGPEFPEGFKYKNSGLVLTKKTDTREKRLQVIYDNISSVFDKYLPEIIILEQLFFFNNQKTAIVVAQAQGVILLLAAQKNIPVHFFTPLQIKQIITGYGQADKKAVQKMLRLTLRLDRELEQDDVADAIASGLAYCYTNQKLV